MVFAAAAVTAAVRGSRPSLESADSPAERRPRVPGGNKNPPHAGGEDENSDSGTEDYNIFGDDAAAQASWMSAASAKSASWAARWRRYLARSSKEHARRFRTGAKHPFPIVRRIVRHTAFETIVTAVITANTIFVGYQANAAASAAYKPGPLAELVLASAEHVFTAAFLIDLVLRVIACGWTWLLASENYLDTFLVFLGVLVGWILSPAGIQVDILRKLTALRTLRLVRLARRLRLHPWFKDMWSLLKGVSDSAETLFWTYVMIAVLLYFFGILATVLIGKQEKFQDDEFVRTYFGDVLRSMLSLFQVMTLDSWSAMCREIMQGEQAWIAMFIAFYITVGTFVLMNLITAVIVENAFSDSRKRDDERVAQMAQEKEKEIEELHRFFKALDADGSGMLSREELHMACKKNKVRQKLRTLDLLPKDLDELWHILDDGDGELSAEEFIGGLQRLTGEAKSKDIMRAYRELRIMESSITDVGTGLDVANEKMQKVKRQLARAKADIQSMQRTLHRAKEAVKVAAKTQPLP